ncbi:uncharacterized protein BDR25DRAFT_379174 [Lindgomyces ingoldianus]|uniref:Uncharacterized protein n=1 Tax=Lindgomyces ingoldianus TaxID=673940 RepID=A0ACB6R9B9_9PLEO|nr:uncharacterized protein BDR25DRAFT_379174 [Lindgomyces ingoldianus]KAF2475682.1 hypothetical protein BDR25DRAFT_379174 [Lindgomyces ingoldianus]
MAGSNSSISPSPSQLGSPSRTSSTPAKTYTISVGNGDHKFRPDVTQAEIGSIVEFDFYPQNHSVVRAEYEYPCIPFEMVGKAKVGFFSGFHPVDSVLTDPPKWRIQINDSSPIFFYCSAPNACIQFGMNSSTSLSHQRDLAQNSAFMLNPGDQFPSEASPTSSSLSLPTVHSSTGTSLPALPKKSALSTGAIAGITVAAVSVILLGALLFFFIGRSRTLKEEMRRESSTRRPRSPLSPSLMFQHQYGKHPLSALPPAYFAVSPGVQDGHGAGERDEDGILRLNSSRNAGNSLERSVSHRSVGGVFDVSPTGHFTRLYEDEGLQTVEQDKRMGRGGARVNWAKEVPLGPYGRQWAAARNGPLPTGVPASTNDGEPVEIDGVEMPQKL